MMHDISKHQLVNKTTVHKLGQVSETLVWISTINNVHLVTDLPVNVEHRVETVVSLKNKYKIER